MWIKKNYITHFTFAYGNESFNYEKTKFNIKKIIKKLKFIKRNDFIVITAGLPFGKAGMTNMIRLYKVGS